uniref:Si:dkey-1m11.6 n=1 Tax=Oryzias latipes TaxID=8090 RepID=A0A3P9I5U1_ORYLA
MSVGKTSGLLTLVMELDFEKERMHQFHIKATDGGWMSKTGMLNVTVLVVDINDNPPVFLLSEYIALVPENSEIGTVVLDAIATDMDSGQNAQIFYSLVAGHVDKFAINAENGTINTLDVFDFEMEQMFDLTVKASNTGRHTLFSVAHVVIQVKDVNEFIPMFGKEEFHFSVLSNVPVGTQIGNVSAVDYDQGSEGQVFYLIFGNRKNQGFDIDTLSGKIYTSSSLRKQGSYEVVLNVLAKNSGVITGMDEDETLVHISVVDINEAPVFTSPCYDANVTEDSPPGASVVTVSASDLDPILDWNHFFFSVEEGNTNLSFAIDPLSGVIFVNSHLDRELWPVYNLTVAAIDNGSPPATGTTNVIVSVWDVNDNAPILTSTEAQVMENQPEGTIVMRLSASDSDLPPNQGPFTYWLLNQSSSGAFLLTADGVLLTTKSLDRETISAYRVLVVVEDAGFPLPLSSTTTFHIKVLDENDNPPLPRNIFIEVKYFGSFFQGGMIGNVHPEDHDESDSFSCVIRSGPSNMFAIPNGTCELWSSPFQGEATFNVTVEAADELQFTVNNSIYVNYKGFTNASIDSCILFYVSLSSMEEFLSNKYLRFVKALDSLFNLQASKTHVFGIKQIGKEILLLAAVKNYNGQYLSKEVANGISTGHKKSLEAQSNVTISHITSDPCFTNPCQNKATCSKNIYISQEVAVLESMAVIFVSPQKEVFNCTCPIGFSGSFCEDDIDECEVNPCKNNGTCENTAGGFICHCPTGFSGTLCSADVDECLGVKCQNGGTCVSSHNGSYCHCVSGFEEICEEPVDHCKSSPCVEGTCMNLPTGFFCNCPFVSGVHCEEHSYGFEELSFMEFPPLDRRTNLIYFEFATVQKYSLILYNPGGSSSRDFFALEIVDGSMQLSYDLGSGPVRLKTHKQIADGLFHSVTARRIGNTLDVGNNNMTFGGLRTLESILWHPDQIKTHDFVGCIRQVHINGILLRPSMALAAFNIFDCTRATESVCGSVPCKNGGVCHDLWSDYLCDCQSPFGGINCATMSENLVMQFSKRDYVEYVIKERFKRDYLLKIRVKKPVYVYKDTSSGHVSEFTADLQVTDGMWHVLTLSSDGHSTSLSVDRIPVFNSTEQSMDLTPINVEKIILGAAPTREFSGCVQYFNVTGYNLPISGHSTTVEVWPSSTLSQPSCGSSGVCLPSSCFKENSGGRTRLMCGPNLQNKSCICLRNVSNHVCDICTSMAHDQCPEKQRGNKPIWITVVVLPSILILAI